MSNPTRVSIRIETDDRVWGITRHGDNEFAGALIVECLRALADDPSWHSLDPLAASARKALLNPAEELPR